MEEEVKVMEEEVKVEEKIKENWADTVEITIPLSKYFKLVKKVEKLKRKVKEKDDKYWGEWRRANEAEKAYKALKADYDAYYGDGMPLVMKFRDAGKPVMVQDIYVE